MVKTLTTWLDYIYGLHTSTIDLGLQRISMIAEEKGLTHFDCPVVMVSGTNGKGSCVKFLESIYLASGYRVGAYYSPHISAFNERICVNEQPITDEALLHCFEQVEQFRKGRPLSFFEFTTLAALWHLRETPLDVILLEIGLGGRLDAVNVVKPDVSVVTSIGIDHQDWLGEDRESIGAEKAGIFRAHTPAICGDPEPPRSLIDFAQNINSKLYCVNKDFSYEVKSNSWNWTGPKAAISELPLPSLKCQNAATSLMAITCLQSSLSVDKESIIKGLKNASLPGRFEEFSYPVNGVLDVAHNADSAQWLADRLGAQNTPGRKLGVVGMLKDKEIDKTIAHLLPHIDRWYVGGLDVERSADPADIVAYLRASGIKNTHNFPTIAEAVTRAIRDCNSNKDDQVVVFGSFHTVAAAKQILANWG